MYAVNLWTLLFKLLFKLEFRFYLLWD